MRTSFKYSAVDEEGNSVDGIYSAETIEQTINYLHEQKLIPINIAKEKNSIAGSLWGFFKSKHYEHLITFTNNLATLHKAGIPLLKSLSLIKIGKPNNPFNEAIKQIRNQVYGGVSLSEAMSEHETFFSKVYISSIAAGEESGQLDEILDKLSPILEKELELTRQIKSGIRYPAMVILAITGAIIVMLTFVVPKFIAFFSSLNAQLPLPTRILTGTSELLLNYWPYLLGFIFILVFGYRQTIKKEKGRLLVDRIFLKIPIIGNIIIKGNVARFAMLFSILIKAGIPLVKALELLQDSVKNSMIGKEIKKLQTIFTEGQENKLIASEFEFFPEMALQMISIGLESGSLEKILTETGEHYSKEVQYQSKQLTSILEPILTLVLGGFVLILALAIFLPMWNLIHIFKG
ncbi:MAG: type II secretion system F family protein [candidate division Zixibacteria bacterium]|nr:type II secretion system F family protein [candidate division Zixibacteria bacterium]